MRALFGFTEVVIPKHGCREREVHVVSSPIRGGMKLPPALDGVRLKRRGLWHHSVRNRNIAKIARAFREGRREEIAKALPGIELALDGTALRDVLLLVENTEHGLALASLLPGWSLWTGENVHEDGLGAEHESLLHPPLNPFKTGPFTAIVTAEGVRNVDMNDVDVLIRADGGKGLPPLGASSLIELDQGPQRPMLLIDFHDRHHPALRKWSRRRHEAYEERGWHSPSHNPVLCRVERFVATRP
jgi:hypothetical protein